VTQAEHRRAEPRSKEGTAMQEPKDPRTSGKVAMYAILVIVALTALMVWVAA